VAGQAAQQRQYHSRVLLDSSHIVVLKKNVDGDRFLSNFASIETILAEPAGPVKAWLAGT
jgi:hypothetical protein